MNRLFLLVSLVTLSFTAFATGPGNFDDVAKMRSAYEKEFFMVPGVNGVGTTACDAVTGEPTQANGDDWIFCVTIYTVDEAVIKLLEERYGPAPAEIDGVFVNYEKIGVITPHPGFTVRN